MIELSDNHSAAEALAGLVRRGDRVLLKASRASRFEEILRLLEAGGPALVTVAGNQQDRHERSENRGN